MWFGTLCRRRPAWQRLCDRHRKQVVMAPTLRNLLIASRELCVCFRSGTCPEIVDLVIPPTPPTNCIVDERVITIDSAALLSRSDPRQLLCRNQTVWEGTRQVVRALTRFPRSHNHQLRRGARVAKGAKGGILQICWLNAYVGYTLRALACRH